MLEDGRRAKANCKQYLSPADCYGLAGALGKATLLKSHLRHQIGAVRGMAENADSDTRDRRGLCSRSEFIAMWRRRTPCPAHDSGYQQETKAFSGLRSTAWSSTKRAWVSLYWTDASMSTREYTTHSPQETIALGRELASLLRLLN